MITSSRARRERLAADGHWRGLTLHGKLAENARKFPHRAAVVDQPNREELTGEPDRRLDFAELEAASADLAARFSQLGLHSGDILLVQLPNVVELVMCYFAASRLGLVVSPVAVQYGAHELRSICELIKPRAAIGIASLRDTALAAQLRHAVPDNIPVFGFGPGLPASVVALDAAGAEPAGIVESSDPDAIVSICWTSGTTGTPKGVPSSHNLWFATAETCVEAGNYQDGDRLLNPFPLINMAALGGFLYPAALQACTLVLHHPLDPALYLRQLQDEKIQFTIAPPALLNQLAQSPPMWQQFDFSSLRCIGSGSAPLSPAMVQIFCEDYGKEIVNFYGSNEGISLFATPDNAPGPNVRATMFPRLGVPDMPWQGRAHEFVKTRVRSLDTGAEISQPGERGELLIAGATVFDGYYQHDNSDVFTADGYFCTGDLVEICGEPPVYYRIVGRCKDIINRGGMKISPTELDILLEACPGLVEAAVCAYPDERLGERICACVVPRDPDNPPALEQICEFLLGQGLAKFKLPERLALFEQLPRNPLNKVQRFLLTAALQSRDEEIEHG